jgi:hypothetical protein
MRISAQAVSRRRFLGSALAAASLAASPLIAEAAARGPLAPGDLKRRIRGPIMAITYYLFARGGHEGV